MTGDLAGLEMHGTGTPLGDPIEVGAALAVLRGSRASVRLSAAKSRVGHAEPAAGAIGMLQVRFANICIASTAVTEHSSDNFPRIQYSVSRHSMLACKAPAETTI